MIHNSGGDLLLEEYARHRRDLTDPKCSALEIEAREFKPIPGGDYHLTMRLESVSSKEKIYGMGQYQQDSLDLKGHDLELAHRNSQASVPFALSSLGYGLLWNNPAIGRAVLGKNVMSFEAYSTKVLDYWIVWIHSDLNKLEMLIVPGCRGYSRRDRGSLRPRNRSGTYDA